MRGHEANTSLLNDNLAKKQTLRTEKLQGRAIKPVRPPLDDPRHRPIFSHLLRAEDR